MIEDFRIQLERVDMYMLGNIALFKPWIWRCTFIADGERMVSVFIQQTRNPIHAAWHFEDALQEFI